MDSRDNRNYGAGRRLAHYLVRADLAKRTAGAAGRGTKLEEMVRSGLSHLATYLREAHGITYLETVRAEHMAEWAQDLKRSLVAEELGRSATSNYVSAVNQVCRIVGRSDLLIDAAKADLSRGRRYANEDLSNRAERCETFRMWLAEKADAAEGTERLMLQSYYHSVMLQETAGLRIRESCCIKVRDRDPASGMLELQGKADCTKNGRDRMAALLDGGTAVEAAKVFVRENSKIFSNGSLIHVDLTWREWRRLAYALVDDFRKETGMSYKPHGNRHAYAQSRFGDLWEEKIGIRLEAPVRAGLFRDAWIYNAASKLGFSVDKTRQLDREIRAVISHDLGHGRLDVVSVYLGR